jgi:hypothetical protein
VTTPATAASSLTDVSSLYGFEPGTVYRDAQGNEIQGNDARGQGLTTGTPASTTRTPIMETIQPNNSTQTDKTFRLPGLDANGLYAGQTGAVDELLKNAYGGLGLTPTSSAGAGAGTTSWF